MSNIANIINHFLYVMFFDQMFDFDPKFQFLRKMIFEQNTDFYPKYFSSEISIFRPKFWFFVKNFDFSSKISKFRSLFGPKVWSKFLFLSTVLIITKNFDFGHNFAFWPKIRFLTQNLIFDSKFDFCVNISIFPKISIFHQKFQVFTQNFNFWPKISIFDHHKKGEIHNIANIINPVLYSMCFFASFSAPFFSQFKSDFKSITAISIVSDLSTRPNTSARKFFYVFLATRFFTYIMVLRY